MALLLKKTKKQKKQLQIKYICIKSIMYLFHQTNST